MLFRHAFALGALLVAVPQSAFAAPAAAGGVSPQPTTPNDVVAAAPLSQWIEIPPDDLIVMDLAPLENGRPVDQDGIAETTAAAPLPAIRTSEPTSPTQSPTSSKPAEQNDTIATVTAAPPRRVVIQLIAPPYAQGWVANIRKLAAAHWWDGLAIVRAQDNYVVQWGDPAGAEPALAKPLPPGLQKMPEADYVAGRPGECGRFEQICLPPSLGLFTSDDIRDAYADKAGFVAGWPVAVQNARSWPVHCYATVGVGRDQSPDTGTGAELYAVIGQAPGQLDRNIAVVGRVIEGIEHLSTLPRGTAELGFYATADERTPILTIRPGREVPELPRYEYLSTGGTSFAQYVHVRANRKDGFYVQPAGGVDVCNVPVPIRRKAAEEPVRSRTKRGGK